MQNPKFIIQQKYTKQKGDKIMSKEQTVMTLEQAYDKLNYEYTTNLEKYITLQNKYIILLEENHNLRTSAKSADNQKETK